MYRIFLLWKRELDGIVVVVGVCKNVRAFGYMCICVPILCVACGFCRRHFIGQFNILTSLLICVKHWWNTFINYLLKAFSIHIHGGNVIDLRPIQSAISNSRRAWLWSFFRCMHFKKYELTLWNNIKMLLVEWFFFRCVHMFSWCSLIKTILRIKLEKPEWVACSSYFVSHFQRNRLIWIGWE